MRCSSLTLSTASYKWKIGGVNRLGSIEDAVASGKRQLSLADLLRIMRADPSAEVFVALDRRATGQAPLREVLTCALHHFHEPERNTLF